MDKGNTRRYLFYAIGEVALVVVGILIALQINNWNQDRIDRMRERMYISSLIDDLRSDSVELTRMQGETMQIAFSKEKLIQFVTGDHVAIDSIEYHFLNQLSVTEIFVWVSTTIEEMKSAAALGIIRDDAIRRAIVELYSNYAKRSDVERGAVEKNWRLQEAVFPLIRNIDSITDQEVYILIEQNPRITNMIRYNWVYGKLQVIQQNLENCVGLLNLLKDY